ncbi:MAG: hypothetical protein GX621_07215 [Pirellulaceae bacterium]|nr:hypothetical protein [Pirellulaceae bacterium]
MRYATIVALGAMVLMPGVCPAGVLVPDQGPVVLELNPALASQPVQEESGWSDFAPSTSSSDTPSLESPSSDTSSSDEATSAKAATTDEAARSTPPAPPQPVPLTDELKTLGPVVRRTISGYFQQPLNTGNNTATDLLQLCMAFGCDAEVRRGAPSGQRLNAFTCLCWNYPCNGREMLRICDDHVAAGVGYGFQQYPGQFLAVLGFSRVPEDYTLRVGDDSRTVMNLVEFEKRNCRSGEDNSFRLIGLARYLESDETWQDDLGETWSIERLVEEELSRPAQAEPAGGTFRLLALSYAVDRRIKREEPIDGQFERAKRHLDEFAQFALDVQNPDGTWHPEFFAFQGNAGSAVDQLRSTGHILRWLAFWLSDEQLRDPRVVRGVTRLTQLLNEQQRTRLSLPAASSREIAARLAAVHALVLYDQRVFVPHDERQMDDNAAKDDVASSK